MGTSEPIKENGHAGKNGDAPSPQKTDEKNDLKTAMQKMTVGKRDLLLQDPNSAVEHLAEACEMLGKLYGETAQECGDAYFYYGKALLELGRLEAGVIDNVLDGVPDESEDESGSSFVEGPKPTDEEKEKIAGEVGDALEENFQVCKEAKKAAAAVFKKQKKIDGKKIKGDATDGNCISNKADKENGDPNLKNDSEENSEEDDDDEEEEDEAEAGEETKEKIDQEEIEDPSNLQLAWEMLELAKQIFGKHADSLAAESEVRMELEAKLSETYQTLGEVSIENENYPQATEDLTMCLRRRQDLLPEDSRCIAETHYQLGVALGFNAQFDEAVNALSDAIAVLEKRIGFLKEGKASIEATKAKDAFYNAEREIKEIEGIIPEIKEKIADTKDMQQETIKKIGDRRLVENMIAQVAATKEGAENAETLGAPAGSSSQKTTSILAVKKRKTSDEPAKNGDAKKPHLENGAASSSTSVSTNGDAKSNGH